MLWGAAGGKDRSLDSWGHHRRRHGLGTASASLCFLHPASLPQPSQKERTPPRSFPSSEGRRCPSLCPAPHSVETPARRPEGGEPQQGVSVAPHGTRVSHSSRDSRESTNHPRPEVNTGVPASKAQPDSRAVPGKWGELTNCPQPALAVLCLPPSHGPAAPAAPGSSPAGESGCPHRPPWGQGPAQRLVSPGPVTPPCPALRKHLLPPVP